MKELKDYIVVYNNWFIEVEAVSKRKAKYQAYLKFSDAYAVSFKQFVTNVTEVYQEYI